MSRQPMNKSSSESNKDIRDRPRAPITVVMPCFCCADTVVRAAESVLDQTLLPQELILIDDGSEDQGLTWRALHDVRHQFGELLEIRVERALSNRGPGSARNAGWQLASQPYIAFLDADDAWHPHKLEIQFEWMSQHPEADVTGTGSLIVSDNWLPAVGLAHGKMRELSINEMLLSNVLPTRSVMLKTSLPMRFSGETRYCEDYLLWLQLIVSGHRMFLIDAPLAVSFKQDFGVTGLSSHLLPMQIETVKIYRQLFADRHIGGIAYGCLAAISWAKFVRRVALTFANRLARFVLKPFRRETSFSPGLKTTP
jgi:hypothetical protein